ncbi:MAG TPA: hypothetical protein VK681_38970 [Reyranella sp.]|nr:hypothetical protein [Reyranella sp.]
MSRRDSRWFTLLAGSMLGLGAWLLLIGAEGDLSGLAASGVSVGALLAGLALVLKMLPPVIEMFRRNDTHYTTSDRAEIMSFLDRRFDRLEDAIRDEQEKQAKHVESVVGAAHLNLQRLIAQKKGEALS